MRSILIALALAAPLSAVAATPTYTNPVNTAKHVQEQTVYVTFVNHTSQEREVRVGDEQYQIRNNATLRLRVPVGAAVSEYSNQNSKVSGLQIMLASAKDDNSAVFLQ